MAPMPLESGKRLAYPPMGKGAFAKAAESLRRPGTG
jgi:hypothetical protein